jgi:hypothetical protein
MYLRFPEKVCLVSLLLFLLAAGCNTRNNVEDDYLLRIDGLVVSGKDYLDALEVMKASYPYEALQNEQVVKTLKTRLLKQLTEELILSRRAEELGLSVSPAELEKEIKEVKKDYPDGVFEKTLLEKAIPLHAWEKRLAMRLLTEKVVDKELVAMVRLTPEEVNELYRGLHAGDGSETVPSEKINASFVNYLRREKAQQQYPQWIDTLQQQYNIELNEARWKVILG